MKGKLIKKEAHYFLEVQPYTLSTLQRHTLIANTFDKPKGDILQLSLKNCQAIERGYDLDELAYSCFPNGTYETSEIDLGLDMYKKGFQKALELLGDNVFDWLEKKGYLSDDKDIIKEEYNHQTEWDVEIEMECCGNYIPPCYVNCEHGPKPKLDADGCLILKEYERKIN